MGLLNNLLSKMKEDKGDFKEKYKQAEIEMKIAKTLEERQKSSNERELENFYKKKHEEQIKMALDKIHKQQTKESWKPKKTALSSDYNILKAKNNFPKQKNMFMSGKNLFLNGSEDDLK
jgi:hypothetical protein